MLGCCNVTLNSRTLIFSILITFILTPQTKGLLKRCYSCRSRGELGNCKDSFPANGTASPTVEGMEPQLLRGVELVPCASGWCGKMLEGGSSFKDDDYGIATQRMCLQRAPSDSEERCAYIKRNARKVFACFCKGDLCNSSPRTAQVSIVLLTFVYFCTRLM